MKRWQQNPPSTRRVVLVISVIGACLAIAAIEAFVGWPSWMTAERVPGGRSFGF